MSTPIKPTLETCAELFRAANSNQEQIRALASANRHGYTLSQITAEVKRLSAKRN